MNTLLTVYRMYFSSLFFLPHLPYLLHYIYNKDMEIQLKRFDIREIKDDKVVVLIGKRDTGKSFLCKDILAPIRVFQQVRLFPELRRRIVFMVKLSPSYLFTMNLNRVSLIDY